MDRGGCFPGATVPDTLEDGSGPRVYCVSAGVLSHTLAGTLWPGQMKKQCIKTYAAHQPTCGGGKPGLTSRSERPPPFAELRAGLVWCQTDATQPPRIDTVCCRTVPRTLQCTNSLLNARIGDARPSDCCGIVRMEGSLSNRIGRRMRSGSEVSRSIESGVMHLYSFRTGLRWGKYQKSISQLPVSSRAQSIT